MARGQRRADVSIGARSRRLDSELRKARRKFKRFGQRTRRDLKRSFTGVKRNIGTLIGFGGIGVFGAAAKSTYDFEKSLTRLQIQSGKSSAFMDKLRRDIRGMSNDTGVGSAQLLDTSSKYVSLTGDIDGASSALTTFGKVAAASGASGEDIAATAAALRQNLKIDPADFEKAFSVLLTQGKSGAVELREMASLLPALGASFQEFGKTGVEGIADLGAALQVTRQAFGSGSEAATGLNGMMVALVKNAAKFKKAGVNVFDVSADGTKSMRNLSDIIADISASKLMKDPEALGKAFGRAEGARAFKTIAKNRAEFERLRDAGLKSNAVQEDFLTFQESAAGRMARAWQRLQNTIAKTITPERVKKFADAMEKIADLVGWIADHAWEITAAFAAFKIGKGLTALSALVAELKALGAAQGAVAGKGAAPVGAVGPMAAFVAALTLLPGDSGDTRTQADYLAEQHMRLRRGLEDASFRNDPSVRRTFADEARFRKAGGGPLGMLRQLNVLNSLASTDEVGVNAGNLAKVTRFRARNVLTLASLRDAASAGDGDSKLAARQKIQASNQAATEAPIGQSFPQAVDVNVNVKTEKGIVATAEVERERKSRSQPR